MKLKIEWIESGRISVAPDIRTSRSMRYPLTLAWVKTSIATRGRWAYSWWSL